MSEDSDSDSVEEIDLTPFDREEIMNDSDNDELGQSARTSFMPDLLSDGELSAKKQKMMTAQFSKVFAEQNPSSELIFVQGSVDDALNQSIFNQNNPRPLILYIRYNKSVADNIFCINFFCSKNIVNYLNKEFIIWPWDRTNMTNYQQFLKLVIEKMGSEIASQIASYSYLEDQYPLLVCLSLNNNQYTIVGIIDSKVLEEDMVLSMLCAARYDFDHRNSQDPIAVETRNEIWHISNSHLTSIFSQSDQFQTIIKSLNIEQKNIINISTIENLIWSIQYSSEKRKIDDRNGLSQHEKELFYGCPLSMARCILQNGFDYNSNRIHGDKYGRGFYFSSKRDLCEKYTLSNESKNDKKAIIKCRVLIDKNRPDEYNSITNDLNTFVVYRNEQILPEYLVIYNE